MWRNKNTRMTMVCGGINMAARIIVPRLIRKHPARGATPQQWFRTSSAGSHRRLATTSAPTVAVAAASESSIRRAPTASSPDDPRTRSRAHSTALRRSGDDAPPKNAAKRSPHSKLLRVCSERNANPHFAAIEADLLRLDWKESMDALVEDWSRQPKRFDDFVELERNVRAYVDKNAIDLTHSEKRIAREWRRGGGEGGRKRPSTSLPDHIRFNYFPYSTIITGMVNRAVAGTYSLSPYEMKLIGGGDNANKIAMAEIRGRIAMLSKAGKLLDAMTSFDADDGGSSGDGAGEDGWFDEDGSDEGTSKNGPSTEANVRNNRWTVHHASCSDCHRRVLSGWFLLYRRLREANRKILADADPAEVLEATEKLDVHPEHETQVWAERWIDFCTASRTGGTGGNALLGGITPADKPILAGVIKILSVSENAKRRAQSVELDNRLAALFPDERVE